MTEPYFPILSFEQGNPLASMGAAQELAQRMAATRMQNLQAQGYQAALPYIGPEEAANLQKQQYENQKTGILMPFVQPNAAAELSQAQQKAQLMTPEARATMALQGAQAANLGADVQKTKFMLAHPGYLAGGQGAQLQYILDALNNNPSAFGASPGGAPAAQAQQPAAMAAANASARPNMAPPFAAMTQQPRSMGGNLISNALTQAGGGQPFSPMNAPIAQPQAPMQQPPQAQMPAGMPQGPIGAPTQGPMTPEDIKKQLFNSVLANYAPTPIKNELMQQKLSGAGYLNLPADSKRAELAQAKAFGYTNDDALNQFLSKKSLEDLAEAKGFGRDPTKWPEQQPNPTIATNSRIQVRQGAIAELGSIDKFITNSLGPYSQTIEGYSPKQIYDSARSLVGKGPLTEEKKQQLIHFYSASMMVPDVNILRPKMMGMTNIGSEVLSSIGKSSQNVIKYLRTVEDPEIWMAAQEEANAGFTHMGDVANRTNLAYAHIPKQESPYEFQGIAQSQGQGGEQILDTKVIKGKTYHKVLKSDGTKGWHEA